MKHVWMVLLGGCLTEGSFLEQRRDALCEKATECDPDYVCPTEQEEVDEDTEGAGTTFDRAAAKACLSAIAEATCDPERLSFDFPAVCLDAIVVDEG